MRLISFFVLTFILFVPGLWAESKPFDVLITNAMVYDGESLRSMQVDVAVHDRRIASIGSLDPDDAELVIDAGGLVLVPGFIDAHTHSDINSLIYPGLANKLMQGVTTEVVGNCGLSAAPIDANSEADIKDMWAREGVAFPSGLQWNDFKGYQNHIERQGSMTHLVGLIGHGNLRISVMGLADRALSDEELQKMNELLERQLEQGAAGISFGLVYLPSKFAEEREIVSLCETVARHSGVCAFHMRSEGSRLIESVQEVIQVGKKTGVKIQISHLKAGGSRNWDKINEAFLLIEEAQRQGVELRADAYPYEASFAELGVILPDAYYEREDRITLFQDKEKRGDLIRDLSAYYLESGKDWSTVMIAHVMHDAYRSYEGRNLREIADEKGKDPVEILVEVLADSEFKASAFSFSQSPQVVRDVLLKPYVFVGSDSIADGISFPHPRVFGSFPKVLRELSLDTDILRIGEIAGKFSTKPAQFFGLKKRGSIRTGYYADLVLFDPDKLKAPADYHDPVRFSEGIEWVFLEGTPVIERGVYTGKRVGHVLAVDIAPAQAA